MLEKIILYLIRKKLGVKKYERFRFTNQKSPDIYYFTDRYLKKMIPYGDNKHWHVRSKVGINWLLDKECKIIIIPYKNTNK